MLMTQAKKGWFHPKTLVTCVCSQMLVAHTFVNELWIREQRSMRQEIDKGSKIIIEYS